VRISGPLAYLVGAILLTLLLVASAWRIQSRREQHCNAAGGEYHHFRDGSLCLRPGAVIHP
jgi:hypothetical protein